MILVCWCLSSSLSGVCTKTGTISSRTSRSSRLQDGAPLQAKGGRCRRIVNAALARGRLHGSSWVTPACLYIAEPSMPNACPRFPPSKEPRRDRKSSPNQPTRV